MGAGNTAMPVMWYGMVWYGTIERLIVNAHPIILPTLTLETSIVHPSGVYYSSTCPFNNNDNANNDTCGYPPSSDKILRGSKSLFMAQQTEKIGNAAPMALIDQYVQNFYYGKYVFGGG